MIPTMIVFGLVLGRWWRSTLVAAVLVWPAMLALGGIIGLSANVFVAAVLGALNAAIGIVVHHGALWLTRRLRRVARTVHST